MDDEMRDAMSQRVGLAGAGTGDDQQRAGAVALLRKGLAMGHGLALRRVELFEVRCGGHEPAAPTIPAVNSGWRTNSQRAHIRDARHVQR